MAISLTAEDLKLVPFFRDLDDATLSHVLDRHRVSDQPAGQTLIMQNDWGENLMVMIHGMAKVRSFNSDGEELVLSLLGSGDLIGEVSLLDGESRSADVVSLTPVRLLKLQGRPMLQLIGQQPSLALRLARLEAGRLRDLNRRFSIQKSDATTRVLDALAYMARKCSPDADPLHVIPTVPQSEIAILAGLARETASRAMSKLRSRGVVIETTAGLRLASLEPLRRKGLLD